MQLGWFTADNAANNDTAIQAVANAIDPSGMNWDPVAHRVRCMEHALHLAVKHFVESVSPTPASTLLNQKEDEEEEGDFEVVDTIGKALALVTQI